MLSPDPASPLPVANTRCSPSPRPQCTPQNCTEKGFFHAAASEAGIAVLYPDTSPRGANLPGETDSWDFGAGAGFYVNATQAPWNAHYNMEAYVAEELPAAVFAAFGDKLDASRVSITGHSMGGHGALTLFLKNPGKYRSVSAFAPIANPSRCPWGEKAFGGYLGADDREAWKRHDATELVAGPAWAGKPVPALIDVGTGDNFYKQGQLLPENFEKAVKDAGVTGVTVRYQEVSCPHTDSSNPGGPREHGLTVCAGRIMTTRTSSSPLSPGIMSTTPPSTCYDFIWGNQVLACIQSVSCSLRGIIKSIPLVFSLEEYIMPTEAAKRAKQYCRPRCKLHWPLVIRLTLAPMSACSH